MALHCTGVGEKDKKHYFYILLLYFEMPELSFRYKEEEIVEKIKIDSTDIVRNLSRMAPFKQPRSLTELSLKKIQKQLMKLIGSEESVYYEHNEKTNQVREILEEHVREDILEYVGKMLPSYLQTKLITNLVELTEFKTPHLIIELLFSEKLQNLTLELTNSSKDFRNRRNTSGIVRINEEDISKTLESFDKIFINSKPEKFQYLQKFLLLDKSEDPDFQGDPINNMTNTNLENIDNEEEKKGDWAGIMSRLNNVTLHLSRCPSLTQLVLPFASDQILSNISQSRTLKLFQNVYRSTVTEKGLRSLADGPVSATLAHLVLSLNTHSQVTGSSVTHLLLSCPMVRVLELGGAGHTKSLYFQGGDAKRRNEVFNSVAGLAENNPEYECNLARILIFVEGDRTINLAPLVRQAKRLEDLTIFGWEHIRLPQRDWSTLVSNIVTLELVGQGCNDDGVEASAWFDVNMLASASRLRSLQVAGWGETSVQLDCLVKQLPQLESLYLEDVKLGLSDLAAVGGHSLTQLSIFHCSTREVNILRIIPRMFPTMKHLTVSSVYLDDPSRGLPFHFHLPDLGEVTRHPLVDLKQLSKMPDLETLHLNVSYPSRLLQHDFALPQMLIRDFPSLHLLSLDNYLSRSGSILSYTFQKVTMNKKLKWFLHQYNRNVVVNVS